MTTEERLARIEEKLIHMMDGIMSVNSNMEKLIIPRLSEVEAKQTKFEAETLAELKLLKIAVGIALLGGIGGGSSIVLRMLGVG